jgi:hypothetical protein
VKQTLTKNFGISREMEEEEEDDEAEAEEEVEEEEDDGDDEDDDDDLSSFAFSCLYDWRRSCITAFSTTRRGPTKMKQPHKNQLQESNEQSTSLFLVFWFDVFGMACVVVLQRESPILTHFETSVQEKRCVSSFSKRIQSVGIVKYYRMFIRYDKKTKLTKLVVNRKAENAKSSVRNFSKRSKAKRGPPLLLCLVCCLSS